MLYTRASQNYCRLTRDAIDVFINQQCNMSDVHVKNTYAKTKNIRKLDLPVS